MLFNLITFVMVAVKLCAYIKYVFCFAIMELLLVAPPGDRIIQPEYSLASVSSMTWRHHL